MVLNNVSLLNTDKAVSIKVCGENIVYVNHDLNYNGDAFKLNFDKALAFPGLINSHDHLDFNCFPKLGNHIYNSYSEWGKTILHDHKNEIVEVLKIPETLRTQWGIYKNLLCGVTSVVNHGKYLKIENPLITVLQNMQNLHSVEFEKHWKLKLNNPLKKNKLCVIHAGEGTNVDSHNEINELIKYNLIKRKLIAVHGVAMDKKQAEKFKALVWCPASNDFLLKKTLQPNCLKSFVSICFGTDSTLTANWNIWEHLRRARKLNLVHDAELFEMLTKNPEKIWDVNSGSIEPNKTADIVIADVQNSFESFYSIGPEKILMIIQCGKIRLFDERLLAQLKHLKFNLKDFYKIEINGSYKYVQGDLPKLISDIKSYNPTTNFPINACDKTN